MALAKRDDNSTEDTLNDTVRHDWTAIVPVQEIDYHWTATVSIGGQPVVLCIDTGSSPL